MANIGGMDEPFPFGYWEEVFGGVFSAMIYGIDAGNDSKYLRTL